MLDLEAKDKADARFERLLRKVGKKQKERLIAALGFPPNVENVPESLWKELEDEVQATSEGIILFVLLTSIDDMSDEFDFEIDDDDAEKMAVKAAKSQSKKLGKMRVRTIKDRLEDIEDVTTVDVLDDMLGAFMEGAAEMIAVTEVNWAATQGQKMFADEWNDEHKEDGGSILESFWKHRRAWTETHPCKKLCRPLCNKPSLIWPDIHPDLPDIWLGPPAHPLCDCILEWRMLSYSEQKKWGHVP